jgi:hypothetical protein
MLFLFILVSLFTSCGQDMSGRQKKVIASKNQGTCSCELHQDQVCGVKTVNDVEKKVTFLNGCIAACNDFHEYFPGACAEEKIKVDND